MDECWQRLAAQKTQTKASEHATFSVPEGAFVRDSQLVAKWFANPVIVAVLAFNSFSSREAIFSAEVIQDSCSPQKVLQAFKTLQQATEAFKFVGAIGVEEVRSLFRVCVQSYIKRISNRQHRFN